MFDPILAEKRFGCGLAPRIAPPSSVKAMMSGLQGPDPLAQDMPITDFETFLGDLAAYRAARTTARKEPESATGIKAQKHAGQINRSYAQNRLAWLATHFARRVHSDTPMLERLDAFWADHFTTRGETGLVRYIVSVYRDHALRPHITGPFETLLFEAVTHPTMVRYLDQNQSFGPNSRGAKGRKNVGLNENLARELLELHTLGVDGPYAQDDVRALAEALTGLTVDRDGRRQFRPGMSEPGPEVILGRSFGGDPAKMHHIKEILTHLARHPATARHISTKLAQYFVAEQPDPDLVDAMQSRWIETNGALLAVYEAMLHHPAAWSLQAGRIKQPFDYIASSLRALGTPAEPLIRMRSKNLRLRLQLPMRLMGQHWQLPKGPDGLPEHDADWLTPQGVAARLQWAIAMPRRLNRGLPDPRAFVKTALGPDAPKEVRFAAASAESKADGIGLVLASPAFQRM